MDAQTDPVIKKIAQVNPYFLAADMVRKRISWDFNYKSWLSRARINKMKDSAKEKKAVILCNGPSLLKVDFQTLKGLQTFGLNKINLLFDKTDFRPNTVIAVNPLVLEQNRAFFNRTEISLLLDSSASPFIRLRSNVAFIHSWHGARFAKDCSISIPQGNTVTYVALQIAFHMGFKDVALVGCDHNFATRGPANMTVNSEATDASHFDPNYFSGGDQWQLPDLPASEFFYNLANRYYSAHGRRIINATEGGKLEIFRRMNLKEWIAS